MLLTGCSREPPRKIVLIGGAKSEAAGRHDEPDGIRALQAARLNSVQIQALGRDRTQ